MPSWLRPDSAHSYGAGSPEWWGSVWTDRRVHTLPELVENGTIAPFYASLLWTLVEHGESVFIASRRSGAGKTTILTSLLDAIPADRTRVWVRGRYDLITAGYDKPFRCSLLVSEVGPDLPGYCWDESLVRVMGLVEDGAQLLATIHADSPQEIIEMLPVGNRHATIGYGVFLESAYSPPSRVSAVRPLACQQVRAETIVRTSTPAMTEKVKERLPVDVNPSLIAKRAEAILELRNVRPHPDARAFAAAIQSLQ